SSRRRHTRFSRDWSSDVCSSDLIQNILFVPIRIYRIHITGIGKQRNVYHQKNQSLTARPITVITSTRLIHTSPLSTLHRLAYQPPKPWPTARVRPSTHSIFPSSANTTMATPVYTMAANTFT